MPDQVTQQLAPFDVDPTRGFLPPEDPVQRLPAAWMQWERLAFDLGEHLALGTARDAIRTLPTLDANAITEEPLLRRAMLLLSIFGNAYVWGGDEPSTVIPASVGVPWQVVADRLHRPMIISHASIVLHNWRRINVNGPIEPDNLRTLASFRGGPDEEWFYLVTAAIEAIGAQAIPCIIEAREAVQHDDPANAARMMERVLETIDAITSMLRRMTERCRPAVFYHRIRPFLTGWPGDGVTYEGVSSEPQLLHGGSAAQSSLLQSLDAALGVEHEHPRTSTFLRTMRQYMPPRHRAFVESLETGPSIRAYAREHGEVREVYDACIDRLDVFRRTHLEITLQYITKQAPSTSEARGTGGTDYADFLRRTRKETTDHRLEG